MREVVDSSEESRKIMLTLFVLLYPTAAVSFGMHVLHNGWAALLLYHAGIAAVIAHQGVFKDVRNRVFGGFRLYPFLVLPVISHAVADFSIVVA